MLILEVCADEKTRSEPHGGGGQDWDTNGYSVVVVNDKKKQDRGSNSGSLKHVDSIHLLNVPPRTPVPLVLAG